MDVAEHLALQRHAVPFALERVREGESIRDLYPLAASRRAEFESWLAERTRRDDAAST